MPLSYIANSLPKRENRSETKLIDIIEKIKKLSIDAQRAERVN